MGYLEPMNFEVGNAEVNYDYPVNVPKQRNVNWQVTPVNWDPNAGVTLNVTGVW
jgi:hypothetical protein